MPNDSDLRAQLIHEYHDAPVGGHLGREKTYATLSRMYYWPHQYRWVRKWVRSCETCQRVKLSPSSQAPLRPLPVAPDAWRSVSMDFGPGLLPDTRGRMGALGFVNRFSKMVHLVPVAAAVGAEDFAALFIATVFRLHGIPESIVSDRYPRFVAAFWSRLFELLGTRLEMSSAAHPETDGQTEIVNRGMKDVLRSYATSFPSWSGFPPLAEFAINNYVHASTGLPPFFVNNARHPRVPAVLAAAFPAAPPGSTLSGGEAAADSDSSLDANAVTRSKSKTPADTGALTEWATRTLIRPSAASTAAPPTANFAAKPTTQLKDTLAVEDFISQRESIVRFVRDALQAAADRQKKAADKRGRKNIIVYRIGDRVLLSSEGIKNASVTNFDVLLAPSELRKLMET